MIMERLDYITSTVNVRNRAQGAYEIKQKSKLLCVQISAPGGYLSRGYLSRGVNLQMCFDCHMTDYG